MICARCFAAVNRIRLYDLAISLSERTRPPKDLNLDGCLPAVAQLHGESLCAGHLGLELARTIGLETAS
jgi:hypothetical protein